VARRHTRQDGFTLIELVVVVAIFGIFMVALGQLLLSNERSYQATDQTADSQQNVRAIAEILERDLRHAGMMVPEAGGLCGVDNQTGPDLLYASDWNAIDPDDDFASYPGATVLTPPDDFGTDDVGETHTIDLSSLVLEPAAPNRPAYDTDGNGVEDSDFQLGGGVILLSDDGGEGTACGRITGVDVANERITFVVTSGMNGGNTSFVAIPANEYRVNNGQLLWNGRLLANDIEDLQIAWFQDDGDNIEEAGEMFGISGNDYDSDNFDHSELRELRISIQSRTRLEDEEWNSGRLQATENRTPVMTNDGFRRRVLTTRVRLRNIGTRLGVV
jgi:prepilin-type N-terminal cleavage/methylation domain-containing protein